MQGVGRSVLFHQGAIEHKNIYKQVRLQVINVSNHCKKFVTTIVFRR